MCTAMFCLVQSAVFVFILNGLCFTSSSGSISSTIEFSKNVDGYILSPHEFRGSSASFCITLRKMYKKGKCEKLLVKIYEFCDSKPNEVFQAPCSLQLESKTYVDDTSLRVHDFLFTDSPSYLTLILADNSCLRKNYNKGKPPVEELGAKECLRVKEKRDQLTGKNTPLGTIAIDYQSEDSSSVDFSESEAFSDFAYGKKSKAKESENVTPVSAKPAKNVHDVTEKGKGQAQTSKVQRNKNQRITEDTSFNMGLLSKAVIEFSRNVDGYTLSSREFQGSSKYFCVTIRNMYKEMKCEKQLVTISKSCTSDPYETFQAPCSLQLGSATFVDDATLRIGDFLFTNSPSYLNFIMSDESCGRMDYKKDQPEMEHLNTNQCLIMKHKIGQLTDKNTQLTTVAAPGFSDDDSSSEDDNSPQNPYLLGYLTNNGVLKPNGVVEQLDNEMSSFQLVKNVHYIVPNEQGDEQVLRSQSLEDQEKGSAGSEQLKIGEAEQDSVPEDYPAFISETTTETSQQIRKLEDEDGQDEGESQQTSSAEKSEQEEDSSRKGIDGKVQHFEGSQNKAKVNSPTIEADPSVKKAVPAKASGLMNRLLHGATQPINNLFNKQKKEFRVVLVYVKESENKKKE